MRHLGILMSALLLAGSAAAYDFVGVIEGSTDGEQYGSAMCTVDFNKDGYPDLAVGAPAADDAGLSSGKVYLYFGGPAADTVADLIFLGVASSFFGQALGAADFNADGAEDLLVGAPFYDLPASNAGAVFIFYGGTSPDTTVDQILTGEAASDYFGISVAGVGDVNSDTYDDIAVGAYRADWGTFTNSGKTYVYYGGPSPDPAADLVLVGEADGERFGYAVTGGDFTGDGIDDIAVGAYSYDSVMLNRGRIYVFAGGTSPDTVADVIMTGDSSGNKFGWSLATGRVNGDAYDDLIMGTDGFPIDTFAAGQVYVFHGGPGFDNAYDDAYTLGRLAHDYLGYAVASGVDVTGDGIADVIAGMPGNSDGALSAGGALLLRGGSTLVPDTTILGSVANEELGHAVVLWDGYGGGSAFAFAAAAQAYNNYRGRLLLFSSGGGGGTPNQPPVLDPIGPQTVSEGDLLSFGVSATDAESIPTLTTSTLPPGATFTDNGDGTGLFSWTPDYTQAGTYEVTFYATDDSLAVDSELVEITVLNTNRAPQITVPGDQTVAGGATLTFGVSATDPDGTTPSLWLLNTPTGASFTDNGDGSGTFVWPTTLADTGLYNLLFVASDGTLSDSGTVGVRVIDVSSCCQGVTGNVNGDAGEVVDIADLTHLIDHLFINFTPIPCPAEGNVNGDPDMVVDIADLTFLIDHLFINFTPLPSCP